MLKQVFYIHIDAKGDEIGAPILISVDKQGLADLSQLDPDTKDTLTEFGAPGIHPGTRVFPKDGEAFLQGLLNMSGQTYRFRLKP